MLKIIFGFVSLISINLINCNDIVQMNKKSTTKVLNLVKRYLPENPTIIEAGAFDGSDTLRMYHFWPKAEIHAFEPDPNAYNMLTAKTNKLKNIKKYNLALSNRDGIAKFYSAQIKEKLCSSGSILPPKEHLNVYPFIRFKDNNSVNTITLDTWAKKNNVSKVDFLWLDIQGAELLALKSGSNLLKNVKIIYTEVIFNDLYVNQPRYEDLKLWLEQQGFTLIAKDFITRSIPHGNAIFFKK